MPEDQQINNQQQPQKISVAVKSFAAKYRSKRECYSRCLNIFYANLSFCLQTS